MKKSPRTGYNQEFTSIARGIYSAKHLRNDLADHGVQTIPYQSEHCDRNWICVASKTIA